MGFLVTLERVAPDTFFAATLEGSISSTLASTGNRLKRGSMARIVSFGHCLEITKKRFTILVPGKGDPWSSVSHV
jgi:hypothetical protein